MQRKHVFETACNYAFPILLAPPKKSEAKWVCHLRNTEMYFAETADGRKRREERTSNLHNKEQTWWVSAWFWAQTGDLCHPPQVPNHKLGHWMYRFSPSSFVFVFFFFFNQTKQRTSLTFSTKDCIRAQKGTSLVDQDTQEWGLMHDYSFTIPTWKKTASSLMMKSSTEHSTKEWNTSLRLPTVHVSMLALFVGNYM